MNYLVKSLFIVCIFNQTFGQEARNRYAIPLKHVDAENIAGVINAILQSSNMVMPNPKENKIIVTFDKSANSLIILALDHDYQKIKRLINSIDAPLPDVELTIHFPSE